MKRICLLFFGLLPSLLWAQSFEDSIAQFQKQYVDSHEVVKGADRQALHFFPPGRDFRVQARFRPADHSAWFSMPTSGAQKQIFRLYGTLQFRIHDTLLTLNLYQSQSLLDNEAYRDYLFLPFTDATTGNETYESGRYLDLRMGEIRNNTLVLDFNKAYNPYCAYVSGRFNCPIPPRENSLPVAIRAGEMRFAKPH